MDLRSKGWRVSEDNRLKGSKILAEIPEDVTKAAADHEGVAKTAAEKESQLGANARLRLASGRESIGNFAIEVRASDGDIRKCVQQAIKDSQKLQRAVARDSSLESEIADHLVKAAQGLYVLNFITTLA